MPTSIQVVDAGNTIQTVATLDALIALAPANTLNQTATNANLASIATLVTAGNANLVSIAASEISSGATLASISASSSNTSIALGIRTDAANTSTDGTAVSGISIWKQISKSIQAVATALVGTNLLGKVGIDQTTPGTTDHVTGSGFTLNVTGTITRPADTTAYSIGQIVAQSKTAASCSCVSMAVARVVNGSGMLRRCHVKVNDNAWLNAQVYIHVFRDTTTFTNGDGAAFAGGVTESRYLGAFDVTLDRQFSDPFVKGIGVPRAGSEMNFDLTGTGLQNVYFVIETRTAVTPGSGKVFTVTFETLQN